MGQFRHGKTGLVLQQLQRVADARDGIAIGLLENEWKAIGRGWKTVGYNYSGGGNPISDAIFDSLGTVMPGIYIPKKIPILHDLQLEQLFEVEFKVCVDECGKEISRDKIGEKKLNKYQEVWFNPTDVRYGDPLWVMPGQDPTSMGTRWGVK